MMYNVGQGTTLHTEFGMHAPPRAALNLPIDAIAAFCARWQIVEFAVFGSVLRPDFHAASDIDVLVRFREGARYTLFDLDRMTSDLETIFARTVDLLDRRAVETSTNPIRRDQILRSAQVVYAA